MYDPKTGKITLISTCFPTHHLVFAEDANNTLWTSAGGPQSGVVGWLNRKVFEETGDEVKSQGWTAIVLDTNGNGKRDDWVEPDSRSITRTSARGFYGIAVNPADGTDLGLRARLPRLLIRLNPGSESVGDRAHRSVRAAACRGYGLRGMDIDRNGVVWTPLSSGHLASFDRRKCKGPLNGPSATGQHCPEGWTLYPFPGPQLQNVTAPGSAESSYYTWVDQFDTFGLGRNVPIATGNANEALLALVNGKFVTAARALSAGLLHEVDGRPHRRSERGLEGQGAVGDLQHADAVPHGGRQGDDEQGGEVPAPAGSAREMILLRRRRRGLRGRSDARLGWMHPGRSYDANRGRFSNRCLDPDRAAHRVADP